MRTQPSPIHFITIAWTALTLIAMQVLLTRMFSVMLFYHFAFAGVTLAMFGLTVGALKVHLSPLRFSHHNLNTEIASHCMATAALLSACMIVMVDVPGRLAMNFHGQTNEALATLAVILPCLVIGIVGIIYAFISAGVVVTLLLTSIPAFTSRLYAVDLVGASMGVVLVILGLKFLDPLSLVLFLSLGLTLCATRLLAGSSKFRLVLGISLALGLLVTVQAGTYLGGNPWLRVRVGKVKPIENVLFERWNTYSHVAVHPNPSAEPFGWGFGDRLNLKEWPSVPQYWLRIDAEAGTVLTRFDGDPRKIDYLKYDVVNLGYHIRDIGQVAVIGVGGGRDILAAISFGVPEITGIEINPAIFEALDNTFADFTGNLINHPAVNLVNAEARSYLFSHPETYEMIQISLIDTWAATAAGGLTLSENKLYTLEAWKEFLQRLNNGGMLSVSRWFVSGTHEGELYRLLSLASDALRETIPDSKPHQHVMAASAQDVINVLVSKTPFTNEEVASFYALCRKLGHIPVLAPDMDFSEYSRVILDGKATSAFYESLPIQVDSPTDDKPFFFNMTRIGELKGSAGASGVNVVNNIASDVLFGMLLMATFAIFYTVLMPLIRQFHNASTRFRELVPQIAYFVLIGLGFMFIEMSLIQRLMIFLGHPVYSLSVILLTMLLFSGIGSYTVNSERSGQRTYLIRPAVLCILLVITGIAVPYATSALSHLDTDQRIAVSVALLAPISFFMGMMFPLGVSLARYRTPELVPWFWALNGAASVLASVGAVITSMQHGITATYFVGTSCYLACSAIIILTGRSQRNGL